VLSALALGLFYAPAASASSVLTPVPGSPFGTGGTAPVSVAFRSDGAQLAVANNGSGTMSVFNVATNGTLTPVQGSPVAVGQAPNGVAGSPSSLLFAEASSLSNTVSMYSGTFQVSGSPVTDQDGPARLAFAPGGQLLAVADAASTVSMFSVGQTGSLTPVPGSPFNANSGGLPGSIAFGQNGHLVAVAGNGNLTEYTVAPTGALTMVPVPGSVLATQAAYSPNGQFLATVAQTQGPPGILTMYSVAPGGQLTEIGNILHPRNDTFSVAFSPDGGLLAVGSFATGSVELYSVGATGGLTPVPGSPFLVGRGQEALAFNPSGTLLAVTNYYDGTVSVFSVAPGAAAPPPSNRFSISHLRINRRNGTITLRVKVPGPGSIDALETVPDAALAQELRPAPNRLAVARKHVVVGRARTVNVTIRLNRAGRLLLRRLPFLTGVRLSIRYTPRGGTPRTIMRRGLKVP
jgi:DNA-binding beta-propeller fold protein YncE